MVWFYNEVWNYPSHEIGSLPCVSLSCTLSKPQNPQPSHAYCYLFIYISIYIYICLIICVCVCVHIKNRATERDYLQCSKSRWSMDQIQFVAQLSITSSNVVDRELGQTLLMRRRSTIWWVHLRVFEFRCGRRGLRVAAAGLLFLLLLTRMVKIEDFSILVFTGRHRILWGLWGWVCGRMRDRMRWGPRDSVLWWGGQVAPGNHVLHGAILVEFTPCWDASLLSSSLQLD